MHDFDTQVVVTSQSKGLLIADDILIKERGQICCANTCRLLPRRSVVTESYHSQKIADGVVKFTCEVLELDGDSQGFVVGGDDAVRVKHVAANVAEVVMDRVRKWTHPFERTINWLYLLVNVPG